jgi:hypothetical protein
MDDNVDVLFTVLKQNQFALFKKLADIVHLIVKTCQVHSRGYSRDKLPFLYEIIGDYHVYSLDKISIIRFLVCEMGCEVDTPVDIQDPTSLRLGCER